MRDDVWRAQIRYTVKKHLDKELQLHNRGIKVLSLFLSIASRYRDYAAAGKPIQGKFAQWFEEELSALAKEPRYSVLAWTMLPMERVHNGYFAQDKKGVLKDTKGDTQADDDVYNLIMKRKSGCSRSTSRCGLFSAIRLCAKDGTTRTFSDLYAQRD